MLSPRFGTSSSDDLVNSQPAFIDASADPLPASPTASPVGNVIPETLFEPPTAEVDAISDDALLRALNDLVGGSDAGADIVGTAAVGLATDPLTNAAIAPLAVGLLPGTVRVTGTTLEFVDGPLGLGGDNNLLVTADGTTLLIQDTLNSLTAGAGTTAVNNNTVRVDLAGLTQISLDGGEGEDSIIIVDSLALGGANLSLTAETLRVNDGVTIATTGNIVFNATEIGTELGGNAVAVNR